MPEPFTLSPLFRKASEEIIREARSEFNRTALGRMVSDGERYLRNPGHGGVALHRFAKAMRSYRRVGVDSALRQLSGTTLGQLARGVQRYSRSGVASAGLVQHFLQQLGPAGRVLQSLMGPGATNRVLAGTAGGSDIDKLVNLVEALTGGFVVRPGVGGAGGVGSGRIDRKTLEKMAEALRLHGYSVFPPSPGGPAGGGGRGGRVGGGGGGRGGRGGSDGGAGFPGEPGGRYPRESIREIPRAANLPPGLSKDHPAVSGDMIPTPNSSNVHSVGWDSDHSFLYVRFLASNTQKKMQGTPTRRRRAMAGRTLGPLYRYEEVSFREFQSLLDERDSPGVWVWDHLRVRGSHAAHQKQYALVGIEGGYVPRRATTDIDDSGKIFEVFKPRRVEDFDGNVYESVLGEEEAPGFGHGYRDVSWGMDTGAPDTGAPDRR